MKKLRRKPKPVSTAPQGRQMGRREAIRRIAGIGAGAALVGPSVACAPRGRRGGMHPDWEPIDHRPELKESRWRKHMRKLEKKYGERIKGRFKSKKAELARFISENGDMFSKEAKESKFERG